MISSAFTTVLDIYFDHLYVQEIIWHWKHLSSWWIKAKSLNSNLLYIHQLFFCYSDNKYLAFFHSPIRIYDEIFIPFTRIEGQKPMRNIIYFQFKKYFKKFRLERTERKFLHIFKIRLLSQSTMHVES